MKSLPKQINNLTLLLFVLCTCNRNVYAQQQQGLSQYHLNEMVFNPAIAGTKGYTSVQTVYRKQWVGVEGAPETMIAYIQAPAKITAGNIGLGGLLYMDKAAAIKRTGAQVTYAQNWLLNEAASFSLALTGSAEQYAVDKNKLAGSLDPGDPLLNGSLNGKMAFDAGFSAYVYGDRWSIGGYASNLVQSKLQFYNNAAAKLYRHYFLMAQYELTLNEEEELTALPAVLVIATQQSPAQVNLNMNIVHQNNKWIGLSYRTNQTHAISGNIGFLINEKLVAGYAYDMVAGKQNRFNAGQNSSHEITLGFRFSQNDNEGLRQVRCPLL